MFWKRTPEMYGVTGHVQAMRAARAAVLPWVPFLAPDLAENPEVVRNLVAQAFYDEGIDPEKVPEANYNKVERHAIAGFLIAKTVGNMLQKNDEDELELAIDVDDSDFKKGNSHNLSLFFKCFDELQRKSAKEVESLFTHGEDPMHTWYPFARERYARLGERAAVLESKAHSLWMGYEGLPSQIPLEGKHLDGALRSEAFSFVMQMFLEDILQAVSSPDGAASRARKHIPAVTRLAGLHFLEIDDWFESGARPLDGTNVWKAKSMKGTAAVQTGSYTLILHPLPRAEPGALKNARLKCPAHTTTQLGELTPLQMLAHATVNSAKRLGVI